MQILSAIRNIYISLSKNGRSPVVILSGDFNAVADRNGTLLRVDNIPCVGTYVLTSANVNLRMYIYYQ